MWFSVVYSYRQRYSSPQWWKFVVDSRGSQHFDHCDGKYRCRWEYRQRWTTFEFLLTTVFNARARQRSWAIKEQGLSIPFHKLIGLFPKWAFLIGYYNSLTHWREQRCLDSNQLNSKLANQIARLQAILVKSSLTSISTKLFVLTSVAHMYLGPLTINPSGSLACSSAWYYHRGLGTCWTMFL